MVSSPLEDYPVAEKYVNHRFLHKLVIKCDASWDRKSVTVSNSHSDIVFYACVRRLSDILEECNRSTEQVSYIFFI